MAEAGAGEEAAGPLHMPGLHPHMTADAGRVLRPRITASNYRRTAADPPAGPPASILIPIAVMRHRRTEGAGRLLRGPGRRRHADTEGHRPDLPRLTTTHRHTAAALPAGDPARRITQLAATSLLAAGTGVKATRTKALTKQAPQ